MPNGEETKQKPYFRCRVCFQPLGEIKPDGSLDCTVIRLVGKKSVFCCWRCQARNTYERRYPAAGEKQCLIQLN